MHPDFLDFVSLAAESGFELTITTNGTLLGNVTAGLMRATNVRQLNISLHSQLGLGALQTYWRSLCTFLDEHAKDPTFPISLRFWNLVEGDLPADTRVLWELLESRYPGLGSWDERTAALHNNPRGISLAKAVYLNQDYRFEWPRLGFLEKQQHDTRGFCYGLGTHLGILCDGTVVPCCLDGEGRIPLGNLMEADLNEILERPRTRAMIEGFKQRRLVEDLCLSCTYRLRFDKA